MAGSEASGNEVVLLQNGIRESAPGSTQQKKEFAGPQKNVQQAAALQIVDVFAVQGYVKSPREHSSIKALRLGRSSGTRPIFWALGSIRCKFS